MIQLAPLLRDLRPLYLSSSRQGFVPTSLPGVRFFWSTEPLPRSPMLYDGGIVIIGQGYKIGYLGDEVFRYDAQTYLVVSMPMPFECETHASLDEPLLGIFIDVDVDLMVEVMAAVQKHARLEVASLEVPRGIEPLALDGEILDATARLLRILRAPIDSQVLGRSIVHEIVYRAAMGGHGRALLALAEQKTPSARLSRILSRIHRDYTQRISVEEMAREAAMSTSAFHRAFKQATGQSPLQYLKAIRLDKAKSLLVHRGMRASEVAFEVGYESPSQFSREFRRYFRVSPGEARALPSFSPGPK